MNLEHFLASQAEAEAILNGEESKHSEKKPAETFEQQLGYDEEEAAKAIKRTPKRDGSLPGSRYYTMMDQNKDIRQKNNQTSLLHKIASYKYQPKQQKRFSEPYERRIYSHPQSRWKRKYAEPEDNENQFQSRDPRFMASATRYDRSSGWK